MIKKEGMFRSLEAKMESFELETKLEAENSQKKGWNLHVFSLDSGEIGRMVAEEGRRRRS